MGINLTNENTKDRGAPNRKLKDGKWPATVVGCEEYLKNKLSLKVTVVVPPTKDNMAEEGPVLMTCFLPLEGDLSRSGNFFRACGEKIPGSPEPADQIGKPIVVISRWTQGRDGYPARAEPVSFLAPVAGQKPHLDLLPPEEGEGEAGTSDANPFGG